MQKIIMAGISIACAAALSGCVPSDPTVSVPQQQAVEAVTAVNAIEVTGKNYLKLALCPQASGTPCRTQAASAVIAPAVRKLYTAKNAALAYLVANPGQAIPITLTDALTLAVANLQAYYAEYGVSK